MEKIHYVVKDNLSTDDARLIKESLGYAHGQSIIKFGFDENTLPHKCMIADDLMFLFKQITIEKGAINV